MDFPKELSILAFTMQVLHHSPRQDLANRPTIADIAQRAGVSVAPVARVLNGHGQECLGTVRRVYDKGLRDMVGAAGMEWTA
ncbi:hypothetical protein DEA8626_03108 [Defluviimonas aquaemixtae]|uniref:HTH lacI-type domain-containing protein n=1 Tax=Albidovulum aquaemixtae TaxID=1542388 RepID=A0A2R8BKV5_9RHOB|nr:hypothetical protein DEA8626_03108 [Defluviimonas aquaemixtae]